MNPMLLLLPVLFQLFEHGSAGIMQIAAGILAGTAGIYIPQIWMIQLAFFPRG